MTMHQGRPPYPSRGGPPQQLGLPPGYLAKGYFDSQGNILPEIIVAWPMDIADKLSRAGLKVAQVRNFFREVRTLEGQLGSGRDFATVKGSILRLLPLATNAVNKGNAPPLFKQFIEQNLPWATKDKKSYVDGFVKHFECVVAYYPQNR